MARHEYLITAAVRRNRRLIKALRLETEDVYQDLMISMLKAIEQYDSMRSESISAYIFAKLQHAILDMKRRYKPGGITGIKNTRVSFVSIENYYGDGGTLDIPDEDGNIGAVDWYDILSALSQSEREALDMNMSGYTQRKKQCRTDFSAACEKLLAML